MTAAATRTTVAATSATTLRGATVAFRLNLLVAAQYRANLLVWSVVSILQAVVLLSVWSAVADAGGGSTGGYTAAEFAGYFLAMLALREFIATPTLVGEFSGYVRRGILATHLLRPLHPLAYIAGGMVAYRLQSAIVMPFVALALALAFGAEFATTPSAAAALLVVVPLAFWTKLLVDAIVACSAMWLVRIDGIRSIYAMTMLLLGGQFAPLSAMPDTVATIARLLPFYWTVGFPTELAIGRVAPSEALVGTAVLAGWSLVLYLVLQPVWRRGTRAYEAVGQ